MQNDEMMRFIRRATEDEQFRQHALLNLEETLTTEGFHLTADELAAVQAFQAHVLGNTNIELGQLTSLHKFNDF